MPVKVRFAPSPTGRLHLGNAYIAVANWLFARAHGGHFLLRLDDTDRERSSPLYEAAIREALDWLGLCADSEARQSERLADYDAARDRLLAMGRLYPAYETPEELALKRKVQQMRGLPPVYDRAALTLSDAEKERFAAEGRRPHYRFKLARQETHWEDMIQGQKSINAAHQSDPVLIREDGRPLYTLSSVVDDMSLAVTHIIRGGDHITNTLTQIQLFEALGGEVPRFAHLPLLADADSSKLSKRLFSTSLNDVAAEGRIEPLALLAYLAQLGTSQSGEVYASQEALAANFQLEAFSAGSPRLDMTALASLNAKLVRQLDYAAVKGRIGDLSADEWQILRDNLDAVQEAEAWQRVLRGDITPVIAPADRDFLLAAAAALPPAPLDTSSWKDWTHTVQQQSGRKGKALFLPLRSAITGQSRGPDMAALLPLIEYDRILSRLKA